MVTKISFVVFFLMYAVKCFFPEVATRAYMIIMGILAVIMAISYAGGL